MAAALRRQEASRQARFELLARVLLALLCCVAAAVLLTQERAPAPPPPPPRAPPPARTEPAVYTYRVVKAYPHDPGCFTQGLLVRPPALPPPRLTPPQCANADCSRLFESAGIVGQSNVREVELESGRVLRSTPSPAGVFAEGLTRVGDRLLQLTWLSGAARWYSAQTLAEVGAASTQLPDGWGVTDGVRDGQLIASDGSATLSTLDANTLATLSAVTVSDGGRPVARLNELELVRGEVWANVWLTDCIARIDPASGALRGWVLMHGVRGAEEAGDVLNGIAWDAAGERLLVTGKYWRRLFHIELVESEVSLAEARRRCIRT